MMNEKSTVRYIICSAGLAFIFGVGSLWSQSAPNNPLQVFGQSFQSRPVAMGTNGVASTPHPLASEAAIEILKQGGNAVDAAVAAAAASSVVQPFTSGIGGIGYATIYKAATQEVQIIDFSGRIPFRTTADLFTYNNGRVDRRVMEKEKKNLLGSLTPGVVAGWEEMIKRHGQLSFAEVLAPAITLADKGFPVSFALHTRMKRTKRRLAQWPDAARSFLNNGEPYAPGEVIKQPDLAATLKRIARLGSKDFYHGETAKQLVAFFQAHGGTLTREDLVQYKPTWLEPIKSRYRGYTIYGAPPPASDAVFLEALNILSLSDPEIWHQDFAQYIHMSVEATKLGRSDRIQYVGDPEFVRPIPVDKLISMAYAKQQKARIMSDKAFEGDPQPLIADRHTIQLCVADKWGNAVNLLQTVGITFGNAVVAGKTGMVMNSMLYFSPQDPDLPNAIESGKRIEMNPLTIMVFDEYDKLFLMLGSPGGKTVIQTVRQMLMNVIDFGLNIQQAIDAPRFLSQPDGITIAIEAPLLNTHPELKAKLEKLGHKVVSTPSRLGSGQGILIDPASGTLMGGTDFRSESWSLAY